MRSDVFVSVQRRGMIWTNVGAVQLCGEANEWDSLFAHSLHFMVWWGGGGIMSESLIIYRVGFVTDEEMKSAS